MIKHQSQVNTLPDDKNKPIYKGKRKKRVKKLSDEQIEILRRMREGGELCAFKYGKNKGWYFENYLCFWRGSLEEILHRPVFNLYLNGCIERLGSFMERLHGEGYHYKISNKGIKFLEKYEKNREE